MKKPALHWRIIIGLILGVIWGIAAVEYNFEKFTSDWILPFGTIFLNLLKLIAVPLVLVSLITGITGLKDLASLSRMGGKTVGIYLVTTVISITIGLSIVNLVKPGHYFSEEKREEFREKYAGNVDETAQTAESLKDRGPLQFLVEIVPENIFNSLGDNRRMLQVIFFALLFGIALVAIPEQNSLTVKSFFSGVNEAILKMVDMFMEVAPYGVFALLAGLVAGFGQGLFELFGALGMYLLTVISGLAFMVLVIYPLAMLAFSRLSYKDFFKGIAPAQLLAFSTSSSAATLPVTMERCEKKLGIKEEVTSFVLPLGATINMDGTSLYQAVATVFIAQAFGTDLSLSQQLTIVLMATISSIGAAPVPGAGMVILVIILQSVGIEPEGLALIVAVDRILDMARTVVNVTGDATVCTIIAGTEKKISYRKVRK